MGEKANLLFAVSHVAAPRQQESKRQQDEQQELESKRQEQVLKAQKQQKEEEKEEAEVKKLIAKVSKEKLDAWRCMRDEKARLNYLSRAEVDDEVLRLVEETDREFGLGKRRMEDGTEEHHEEWRLRMLALREKIYRLWNDNEKRIRGALPRYVEGSLVRDAIVPPKFVGERRQRVSGLGTCFQCHMQGMACSRGVITARESGKSLKSQGCERCERKGYRCIVEYEVDSDPEEGIQEDKATKKEKNCVWDWVDESVDTEPVEETLEMWRRRRRGDKLEVIGNSMQWVESGSFALPSREKAR